MPKRLKIEAIVPAAGLGKRLKGNTSKPLVLISGSPIIMRTLRVLNAHPRISKIIVLSHKKNLKTIQKLISRNSIYKLKSIVEGGVTRSASVAAGLKLVSKDADFVLIHDAARPFVNKRIISRVISAAVSSGAAVAGVRLRPTIKRVKGQGVKGKGRFIVEKTIDRECLWEIQTPQVFKKDLILKAHKRFSNLAATDDACLVEKLGKDVCVVEGSYFNIKVTTPEDLVFAKAIVKGLRM